MNSQRTAKNMRMNLLMDYYEGTISEGTWIALFVPQELEGTAATLWKKETPSLICKDQVSACQHETKKTALVASRTALQNFRNFISNGTPASKSQPHLSGTQVFSNNSIGTAGFVGNLPARNLRRPKCLELLRTTEQGLTQ